MEQKLNRLAAIIVGLTAIALLIGGCNNDFKKKPTEQVATSIVYVPNFTPAMRVITDTFRYSFNADSSVAKKVEYRDTFYLIGITRYDSTKKKDTTLTYVVPKEFVIKEKGRP